jgi:hypothetical protein
MYNKNIVIDVIISIGVREERGREGGSEGGRATKI